MKKFTITFVVFILFSIIILPISKATENTQYVWSNNIISTSSNDLNTDLNLTSESCILIEQNSGTILYEKNSHEKLRPASVTKIMSILLIMEALDSGKISLNDKVPCSENAAKMGGSQIWLDTKEELTVNEMLKAICVASANDCTYAMAEYLSGSEEAFVKKMNEKAIELGMNDTVFKNCHGLDTDGHVTSSNDIAIMSRELLSKHPKITEYSSIYMDTLRDGKSELVNTNKLIKNYKGATGLKTGSTNLALYNLSASATRDNLSLIAVIMKAPTTKDRFSDAKKLLDYGFNNYSYIKFTDDNKTLSNINVEKGVKSSVNITFSNNSGFIIKKGEENRIEQIINIPDKVSAPISQGQKIGEIEYVFDNKTICKNDLIATEEIKKVSLTNMVENIFFKWFRLLR